MQNSEKWSPKFVEIEPAFDEFVRAFRKGCLIRDLMPAGPSLPLNADYLFSEDDVIAELKCLTKNPTESSDWPLRIAKAFRSTGHNFSDLMGYLLRGEPMPERPKAKLIGWIRESIRDVVKTGNRQIRATKRALKRDSAQGLLLIANDNNYGFTPTDMMRVIGDAAARLPDNHLDGVVYFTPNVFHHKPGSDVAWQIWDPRYRDETDDKLPEFVNEMGRKWGEYLATITNDPLVEREDMPDVSVAEELISTMRPVRTLGKAKSAKRS